MDSNRVKKREEELLLPKKKTEWYEVFFFGVTLIRSLFSVLFYTLYPRTVLLSSTLLFSLFY
jgi:hypothetical protein